MNIKPVFLLVHGAGLGGWCWQRVELILRQNEFKVFCPTLTGLPQHLAQPNTAPTLKGYIQEIVNLITAENLKNIILVGHSFGGMVITGVADQALESISRLIYLDAAVPKNGDDFASHIPGISKEDAARHRQAFIAMARDQLWIDPIDPRLAGVKDKADIKWTQQNSTPHPVMTWLEKIDLKTPDKDMPPRTYVLAVHPPTDIMGYPAHGLTAQHSQEWGYREIKCGHAMMIACPEETAKILLQEAQDLMAGHAI